jgi:hypothetical protein
MTENNNWWRSDLHSLPACERRPARFALGLLLSSPSVNKALEDRDFLHALWILTQPLLTDETQAALYQAAKQVAGHKANRLSDLEKELTAELQRKLPQPQLDEQLCAESEPLSRFYRQLPRTLLAELDAIDEADSYPSPVAHLLSETLGLDSTEQRILEYLELREHHSMFETLLREGRLHQQIHREVRRCVAGLLRLDETQLRHALRKGAPLRALGLIDYHPQRHPGIDDFLRSEDLLIDLFEAEPEDEAALLARLVEPAPAGDWTPAAFPHLRERVLEVQETLAAAARSGVAGINALFYGPPGTGKTELARALTAACGLTAYQVASTESHRDGDEYGLGRDGRLSAYLVAQRLLAKRGDAVIIFDEVEDVITQQDSFFAFFGGAGPTGEQKGWMNRILEENPVPAIWISNQTRGMDPAFQRRFLLPVAFVTPPRSVRLQMAERHLGDLGLPPTLLEELAADDKLTPATLGAARRLLDLRPDAPQETTVRRNIAAMRRLLHGAPAPRRREQATDFDVGYLNLAGGIQPVALVQALKREGTGRLCF